MKSKQLKIYREKFAKYMDKYGHLYSDSAQDYINENLLANLDLVCDADILMQIKQAIGVKYAIPSFYEAHLNRIMSNFNIGCNIVEVGSGMYPALGNLIAVEQLKIKKGTITLYDPVILTTKPKYRNMKLYREMFDRDTDIKSTDLIIGTMPCEATEDIIETACENHKHFYVAMCGCTHFDYISPYMIPSPELYQDYVIDKTLKLMKKYDNGELIVDQLDNNYEIDYPILYNKK